MSHDKGRPSDKDALAWTIRLGEVATHSFARYRAFSVCLSSSTSIGRPAELVHKMPQHGQYRTAGYYGNAHYFPHLKSLAFEMKIMCLVARRQTANAQIPSSRVAFTAVIMHRSVDRISACHGTIRQHSCVCDPDNGIRSWSVP